MEPTGFPRSPLLEDPQTRFFVITSNNGDNVVKSVEHNVWATQRKNDQKLNDAYRSSTAVILIFSVHKSGAFQGYCRMQSSPGRATSRQDPFGGYGKLFDVEWLRLHDVDIKEVQHIRNPLDENRQIGYTRDGVELLRSAGQELCRLIDLRVFKEDPENYEPIGLDPTPLRSPSPLAALPPPPQSALPGPGHYGGSPGSSPVTGHGAQAPPGFGMAPPGYPPGGYGAPGSQPPSHRHPGAPPLGYPGAQAPGYAASPPPDYPGSPPPGYNGSPPPGYPGSPPPGYPGPPPPGYPGSPPPGYPGSPPAGYGPGSPPAGFGGGYQPPWAMPQVMYGGKRRHRKKRCRSSSSGSSSESDAKKKKRKKKTKDSKKTKKDKHNKKGQDGAPDFKSMNYEDYMAWWSQSHGTVAGGAQPPGASVPPQGVLAGPPPAGPPPPETAPAQPSLAAPPPADQHPLSQGVTPGPPPHGPPPGSGHSLFDATSPGPPPAAQAVPKTASLIGTSAAPPEQTPEAVDQPEAALPSVEGRLAKRSRRKARQSQAVLPASSTAASAAGAGAAAAAAPARGLAPASQSSSYSASSEESAAVGGAFPVASPKDPEPPVSAQVLAQPPQVSKEASSPSKPLSIGQKLAAFATRSPLLKQPLAGIRAPPNQQAQTLKPAFAAPHMTAMHRQMLEQTAEADPDSPSSESSSSAKPTEAAALVGSVAQGVALASIAKPETTVAMAAQIAKPEMPVAMAAQVASAPFAPSSDSESGSEVDSAWKKALGNSLNEADDLLGEIDDLMGGDVAVTDAYS